jgi:prephenate dehydratase
MKTSLVFSIPDEVGALENVLKEIKSFKLSMTRIESRPSKTEVILPT